MADAPGGSMMRGNRVLVVVAAVGLLAAVMAWMVLEDKIADAKPAAGAKILVATADLRPGVTLSRDSARVSEIPVNMQALASMSMKPEQIAAVEGAEVSRFVPAGTPLLYSDLAQVRDIRIEEPWRALTVAVSDVGAMDGLLVPGDHIEMYVTRQLASPAAPLASIGSADGDPQAMMMQAMAQAMRPDPTAEYKSSRVGDVSYEVLAVGSRLSGTRQQVLMQRDENSSAPSSVTIKVRGDQVERILQSTGAGEHPVQMVLCPKVARPVAVPK